MGSGVFGLNVFVDLLVLRGNYLDEACDFIGGLVVEEEHVLEKGLEFVVQVRVKLLPLLQDKGKLVLKIDSGINFLIDWQAPDLSHAFCCVMQADIKKLKADSLEFGYALMIVISR